MNQFKIRRNRKKAYKRTQAKAAMFFLAPSMIGVSIFILIPFVDTIRRSFMNARATDFVGFENYINVCNNTAFQLAAKNTAKFISICVPLLLLVSLLIAIMVKGLDAKGKNLKTIYLIPMAIPVASIAMLWQVMFHNNGLLNAILISFDLTSVDFMNTNTAFWVLIFTYIWKNSGYNMILWLAGMDSISEMLYQASAVDGANKFQQFRYITMPSLMPTAVLISILSLINTFKVFREAYLVAGNYPHESIYLLQHLFNNWFRELDLGRVTAASVLLLLVLLVIILFLQKLWKDDD